MQQLSRLIHTVEHCLQYTMPDFRSKVKGGQQIIIPGKAFGVGSSREQAPRALKGEALFPEAL